MQSLASVLPLTESGLHTMSKSSSAGLAAVVVAILITNPTVRKGTAKLLRKAAKFLDEPRPLPVAPPPMWSPDDQLSDPLEQPEEKVSSRLSLKDFQASH